MPTAQEGRRLTGYDLGKTISYLRNGNHWAGEIADIEHTTNGTTVHVIDKNGDLDPVWIPNGDTATITGKPS